MTNAPLRLLPVWQTIGLLLCALVVYLSLTEDPIELPADGSDRYGHVLAYAVLMFWFAQIDRAKLARVAWAFGLVAMGIALEFLQRLTETRSFSGFDMAANACGVGIGWLIAPPRSPQLLRYLETRWLRYR